MGLDLLLVISPESHSSEFVCVICCQLCDLTASLTRCSHVYCDSCLSQWLTKASRCPSCNKDLSDGVNSTLVSPLKTTQALAYRVLRRVRVRCPVSVHGCPWTGDYGDLQGHLMSSDAHAALTNGPPSGVVPAVGRPGTAAGSAAMPSAPPRQSAKAMAATYKEQADSKFSARSYGEAEQLYSKALSMFRTDDEVKTSDGLYTSLLANRSACRLMLKDFEGTISDCNRCLELDPSYTKVYVRRGKALTELGRFEEACNLIAAGCEILESDALIEEASRCHEIRDDFTKGLREMVQQNYSKAKATFGSLLGKTSSLKVVLAAARTELGLGQTDRALRLSLQVNRQEPKNAEAYEIRGRAMFFNGDFESALALYREASRLDPDLDSNKNAIRNLRTVKNVVEDARGAAFNRDFKGAASLFTVALESSGSLPATAPLNASLHAERAGALLRAADFEGCIRDCDIALYGKDDCKEAWVYKVKALHALGRHEEALSELEPLMEKWGAGDDSIRTAYERAQFEVRKAKRVDYYAIFGLPSVASEMEIKKRFKIKALEYHPDKNMAAEDLTPEQKKELEEKFKMLGEGLEILCDPQKRKLYDEGYDKASIEERVAAANRAAHNPQHGQGYHNHRR